MYVKNEQGDRLLVYITKEGVVIPKDEELRRKGSILRKCIVWDVHGTVLLND